MIRPRSIPIPQVNSNVPASITSVDAAGIALDAVFALDHRALAALCRPPDLAAQAARAPPQPPAQDQGEGGREGEHHRGEHDRQGGERERQDEADKSLHVDHHEARSTGAELNRSAPGD